MAVDASTPYDAAAVAVALEESLLEGNDYSIPPVNVTGPSFALPDPATSPFSMELEKLSIEALTTQQIDGTGVFDHLMKAASLHLESQYRAGRINANDYAKVYIESIQAVLQQSMAFLMGKDAAYIQALTLQAQGRAAEVAVVTARAQLEMTKAQAMLIRSQAEVSEADAALKKLELAKANVQHAILQEQHEQAKKATELAAVQISQAAAQKDQILYITGTQLPAQVANVIKDTEIKDYQLTWLLPLQKGGAELDNVTKGFNNTVMLPAQYAGVLEQNEAHRAKTADWRSDGIARVAGIMGMQKDLYAQQIESYKNADQSKIMKMMLDQWMAKLSVNEGTTPPSSTDNAAIDSVVAAVRTNLGLV